MDFCIKIVIYSYIHVTINAKYALTNVDINTFDKL